MLPFTTCWSRQAPLVISCTLNFLRVCASYLYPPVSRNERYRVGGVRKGEITPGPAWEPTQRMDQSEMSSPGCRPSPPELNNATINNTTPLCEVHLRFKEDLLRHFSCRSLPSIPTQVRWRLERLWDLYTTIAYWISHSTYEEVLYCVDSSEIEKWTFGLLIIGETSNTMNEWTKKGTWSFVQT